MTDTYDPTAEERDEQLTQEDELQTYEDDWREGDLSEATIDEHIEAPVSLGQERQAVRFLCAYSHLQVEAEQVAAAYNAEIQRLQLNATAEAAKRDGRMAWLSQALAGYYHASGATKITLPYGTLSQRKQPERITIEDIDAFCQANSGSDLVRTKETPDKKAIKQHIKADGEIPDGVEVERADPKFTITTT